MMDINKARWEKTLDKFPDANFLQSWAWGEFHKKLGRTVYRVEFKSGIFQAIVESARRGKHLIVPGGPLLSNYFSLSLWKQAVLLIKQIAEKEKCVFIRIRPQVSDTSKVSDTLNALGFRPAPMHLHAQLTRLLDLSLPDDELLAQMRKSTRYEIRRALKMGIKVEKSQDENLINDFIELQTETAKREGFVPFAKEYLLEQFREFKKTGSVLWFFVSNPAVISSERSESRDPVKRLRSAPSQRGLDSSTSLGMTQIISIAFVIFCRGEAVYHYAASNGESRKIPAAYAIQWAIIQEAKNRGCKTYNLWGDVADDKLDNHRFAGPSLFKRGFGGRQFAYFPAHDLPLTKKYWVNYAIEIVRKSFRSL